MYRHEQRWSTLEDQRGLLQVSTDPLLQHCVELSAIVIHLPEVVIEVLLQEWERAVHRCSWEVAGEGEGVMVVMEEEEEVGLVDAEEVMAVEEVGEEGEVAVAN